MHKVLEDEDTFEVKTGSYTFKMALMKARQAKKLSQKDLASRISVKPIEIQMLEQGKSQPTHNIIRKLERTLNCKLPRVKKNKNKNRKRWGSRNHD